MKSLVVMGAQWGDEGKGKVVDVITSDADWVVRFQGGNNAGHTLVVEGKKTKLHLIPSGILRPSCRCAIGGGVVFDAAQFLNELDGLAEVGIDVSPGRVIVDPNVELVVEYHRAIDRAREEYRGTAKIGTTGRGIGPAYEDRAGRCGIRLGDLYQMERLKPKVIDNVEMKNRYLKSVLKSQLSVAFEQVWDHLVAVRDKLLRFVGDVGGGLDRDIRGGATVVFEGAQGILLDQGFGTVPYVTSSHTIAGAAATGCGIGPQLLNRVVGVAKAYCTRVGEGPFPTEIEGKIADLIREKGAEFGTTTGRPRRCGWLDVVGLRHAVRLSGLEELIITKLDVLSGLEHLKLCHRYSGNGVEGSVVDGSFPAYAATLGDYKAEYLEFDGWQEDLSTCRSWQDLPSKAREYLQAIEESVGCKIAMVSVGPDREETIVTPGTRLASWIAG